MGLSDNDHNKIPVSNNIDFGNVVISVSVLMKEETWLQICLVKDILQRDFFMQSSLIFLPHKDQYKKSA